MKRLKKLLYALFTISFCITVFGCDDAGNGSHIQLELDAKNPNKKQAFCVRVSDEVEYGLDKNIRVVFDIIRADENDKSIYHLSKVRMSEAMGERLSAFEKVGLLRNDYSDYSLAYSSSPQSFDSFVVTAKGRKFFKERGGLNFCFGRIVVDEELDTIDSQSSKGVNFKTVNFTYHLEGVPAWMQEEVIYSMYSTHTDFIGLVFGKQLTGKQTYKVADDGTLTVWEGIRGNRYIL